VSNDKDSEIVPKGPQGLLKTNSSLVRRGLDDLSKRRSGSLAADHWFEKGFDSWADGHHADAIACFDRAIEIYPAHVDAWFYKSWSLTNLGRLTDSIESLNKCLEIDPSSVEAMAFAICPEMALEEKGRVLAKLRRFEEALECYDAANRLWPANVSTWSKKGEALYELRRYDEAILCYHESLNNCREWSDLAPNFVSDVLSHKADALLKLCRFEEAVLCYNESLSHHSLDVVSPYTLFPVFSGKADALVELGRIEDAINSYENYLIVAAAGTVAAAGADSQLKHALECLRDLKLKTQALGAGSPRYAYVVREEGAPFEPATIGYPDIETAILEALKQKAALYAAGKLSDEAYRGAVNQYQTMIKEHIQKNRQQAHE
jgi:tetratricopeptide (TPR) repeat protein